MMKQTFAQILLALLLIATVPGTPFAQTGGDGSAIQSVISNQIAAFRAGDSTRAYSYASPGIQRMFPSPGIFMQMVEQGYEPVFRPRSFAFIDQSLGGDEAVQFVDVVGPDGAAWIAMYTLERQTGGDWKITGCQLKPGVGA